MKCSARTGRKRERVGIVHSDELLIRLIQWKQNIGGGGDYDCGVGENKKCEPNSCDVSCWEDRWRKQHHCEIGAAWGCVLVSYGSQYNPVEGFCEHGNELSVFYKSEEFIFFFGEKPSGLQRSSSIYVGCRVNLWRELSRLTYIHTRRSL
jgi:hypothetical protein